MVEVMASCRSVTSLQDDEAFTFRLNVAVSDDGGRWSGQPVSAVCPGLSWTHREIVCEEDYMEVRIAPTTCSMPLVLV